MTPQEAYKTIYTESPEVVNVNQLCEILRIGKSMGHSLLKQGKIQCFIHGNSYRIPKAYILSYMGFSSEKVGDTLA